MSGADLLATHQPTDSWLHRLPVGVKYAMVLLPGIAILAVRAWWLAVGVLLAAVVVLLTTRIAPRWSMRLPWVFVMMAVLTSSYGFVAIGWRTGLATLSTIIAGLYLARVLTLTTPAADLVDGLAAVARPLDRVWPAASERFALAVALMVRSVPQLIDAFTTVRDALRARGLQRRVDLALTPVVVHAVGQAQRAGEALMARGLGDADPGAESGDERRRRGGIIEP